MDNKDRNNCNCVDPDSQMPAIKKIRKEYCSELYVLGGDVMRLQVKKNKFKSSLTNKLVWLNHTERNYLVNRHIAVHVAGELSQTSDSVKEGIKSYMTSSKGLQEQLKKLQKSVDDLVIKAGLLKTAAFELKSCKEAPCNCSQLAELGIPEEGKGNCPPTNGPKTSIDSKCTPDKLKEYFKTLIEMPGSLESDAHSVATSTANTRGIQTFTNSTTLETLNASLAEKIKKFETVSASNLKRAEGAVKNSVDELAKIKKDQAKTWIELYGKRNDFEAVFQAVKYYCCTSCECIPKNATDFEPRLKCCEKKICEICGAAIDKKGDCGCHGK